MTDVRTVQEFGIAIREIVAFSCATLTQVGTCATHIGVTCRFDQQQAGTGLTQLRTSQEQRCHIFLGGEFTTIDVRNNHQTRAVTIQTVLDTFVSVRGVVHGNSPLSVTHV